ncbi:helix-turn-helix transcriptional regulator [Salinibacterium sp. dk2585]|uniref:helix-turn-helix domain-containing protein n=1 Tax=unclassified Salinibacterium TaxID=2632331 RepID=UPI0011C24534|nr:MULTISPECIES: helix-turn-helix transcriptional regulator [unclassified Salinibacterium]QEE62451.1 helix-turn-helix transcriptional regulator [Salinibacterium sp. dk2585]TXK55166.1 helix-turn-helix transcriptional regulator [Salinibacterium sp. dk5596]
MSRPSRPQPRDGSRDWPDVTAADPVSEVARRFAENVRTAIGDQSIRAAARDVGVAHTTIVAILQGRVWPDLETIAKLEQGLGVDLWPGRVD